MLNSFTSEDLMAIAFSHYSYLSTPAAPGGREPTGLLDLRIANPHTRRLVIHGLMRNGELMAKVPHPEVRDMKALRAALKTDRPF